MTSLARLLRWGLLALIIALILTGWITFPWDKLLAISAIICTSFEFMISLRAYRDFKQNPQKTKKD